MMMKIFEKSMKFREFFILIPLFLILFSLSNKVKNEYVILKPSYYLSHDAAKWQTDLMQHISNEQPFFSKRMRCPQSPTDLKIDPETYVKTLAISVFVYDADHLNIIIRDALNIRWELPFQDPYPHPNSKESMPIEQSNFEFFLEEDPFEIVIRRKSTKEIIFRLAGSFIFSDLYIHFTVHFPTTYFYGLGERIFSFQFKSGQYTLFTVDRSGEFEDGTPGHNVQGHHPMYLMKEESENYHLVLFRNVNAQEINLNLEAKTMLWQTIGGVIDLNIFLGDKKPETVIQKYHKYIGGWIIPPFWAMGHHHSKWGMLNIVQLQKTMEHYNEAGIPIDSIWSDLDYMVNNINFSFDEETFPLEAMRDIFQKYNIRWIPLVDPWLPAQQISYAHTYPNAVNLSIRLPNGEYQKGITWSGNIFMLDFVHPEMPEFWGKMLDYLNSKLNVSGIWLDLNEITYLCKYISEKTICDPEMDKYRKYYYLPFYPGKENFYNLFIIPIEDIHYDNTEEFNVRSMMGLLEQKLTYDHLSKNFSLPFSLSRGTLFGAGKYTFHWLADIRSSWISFQYSISSCFNFNLFGITMIGPDICGFGGATQTESELCARWYQMGAFYPFFRNHHHPCEAYDCSQEPFSYSGIYFNTIYNSIQLRYSLVKYYYSLFFTKPGDELRFGTIFQPLNFIFIDDPNLKKYGNPVYDSEIMIGDSLLIIPVLQQGLTVLNAYFPNKTWYDLRDNRRVPAKGQYYNISASLTELTPHFLMEGGIFYKQRTKNVYTTNDLGNRFQLIIALNNISHSAKTHFLDVPSHDEYTIHDNCVLKNCLLSVNVEALRDHNGLKTLSINSSRISPSSTMGNIEIDEISLLGAYDIFGSINKIALKDRPDDEVQFNFYDEEWFNLKFNPLVLNDKSSYEFIIS